MHFSLSCLVLNLPKAITLTGAFAGKGTGTDVDGLN